MDRKEDRKSLHEKGEETECSESSGDSDTETSHSRDEGKHSESSSGEEVDCNQNQGACERSRTEDAAINSETNVENSSSLKLTLEHPESVWHNKEGPNDHLRTTDEEKSLKLSKESDLEDKRSRDNCENSNSNEGTAITDTATGHQEISPRLRNDVKCTRSRENCECFKSNKGKGTRTLNADKKDKTSKVKDGDDAERIQSQDLDSSNENTCNFFCSNDQGTCSNPIHKHEHIERGCCYKLRYGHSSTGKCDQTTRKRCELNDDTDIKCTCDAENKEVCSPSNMIDIEPTYDQGTLGTDIQQARKSVNGYTTIYDRRNGQGSRNERVLYTRTNGNGSISNGEERKTAATENATSEPRMDFFKAEIHIDNDNDSDYSSFRSNHECSFLHRDVSSETCFDSGIDTDSQGSETHPKEINRAEIGVHEHSQQYEQMNQNSDLKRISVETENKQEVGKNMTHCIKLSSSTKSITKLQRSHESNDHVKNSAKESVLSSEDVKETVGETRPKTINVNADAKIQQRESNGIQQNVAPDDKLPDKDSTEKKVAWPGYIPHQEAAQDKESCEVLDTDNTTPKESLISATTPMNEECLRNCSNTSETVSPCSEDRVVESAVSSDPNENSLFQENGCESNESGWVVVNEGDVNEIDSIHSENNEGVEQNDEKYSAESEGQDVVYEFKENQHP